MIKYKGQTIVSDGFSPTVRIQNVSGGHIVNITDKNETHSFIVADGNMSFEDLTPEQKEELRGPKGDPGNYEAGNGISIEQNTINVETPVKTLTQTEYDALSEDQKISGLYFIPDNEPEFGSPNGYGWDVYSTEEQRIGTWIDGKPLYRTVLVYNHIYMPNNQFISLPGEPIENVEQIVNFNGSFVQVGAETMCWSLNCQFGAISPRINEPPAVRQAMGDSFTANITIILEYTKTID